MQTARLDPVCIYRRTGCLAIPLLVLISAVLGTICCESADPLANAPAVIAYLPEYRLAGFTADRLDGLTDLVLFSIEPKPSGVLDTIRLKPEAIRKVIAACREKKVRVTIALGGWERSKGFARMARNAEARQRFAKNLTSYCLDNQLAGADFDWEHPHDVAEEQAYADLMVETKRQFKPHKLTLSAALAGWQNLPAVGFEALDRIHLMAYDHDEPRHASLDLVQADIKQMLAHPGMSPEKLCVGIPCYARGLKNRGKSITYAEIVDKFQPAANLDETDEWYFNGLDTVRTKARLVRDQTLGGVMFWELGQDATGDASLIRAARRELTAP